MCGQKNSALPNEFVGDKHFLHENLYLRSMYSPSTVFLFSINQYPFDSIDIDCLRDLYQFSQPFQTGLASANKAVFVSVTDNEEFVLE